MSYLLETTPRVDQDLKSLNNPALERSVIRRLLELAGNPGKAGTRSSRPPFPKGQLFEFAVRIAGDAFWVGAIFQYSQDETTLEVSHIFVELILH